jgi:hypothetical protein
LVAVFQSKEWMQRAVRIPLAEEKAAALRDAQRREHASQAAYRTTHEKAVWTETTLQHMMDDHNRIKYDNEVARWCYEGEGEQVLGPYPMRALHAWFEGGSLWNSIMLHDEDGGISQPLGVALGNIQREEELETKIKQTRASAGLAFAESEKLRVELKNAEVARLRAEVLQSLLRPPAIVTNRYYYPLQS